MSEQTAHELMESYAELAAEEAKYRREKGDVLGTVSRQLADSVADAVEETGLNVEVVHASSDGTHQTLRPRFDRAALVAALNDHLPDGFVVEHVNEDGTLTVQWDERETVRERRHNGAILKAIVAEETETDGDGLIESVPTRERVIARAVDLDVPEDAAADRLARLADLDVVDLADGKVYPDSNFSKV
ncbi:hypothetical protein SAMN05216388_1004225 [Halorientalis persicus]|uniref:Uncharacterized protein n=1 Tax=Halorientalis persicus TaxID=1367881 RepID=A0A1H8IPE6_9EURY|nr:hypothetical protein [Halorientalis persicus]SEN70289.1 hypothetical protein SAMN05216388_1004225 [Halorientalis persicus]